MVRPRESHPEGEIEAVALFGAAVWPNGPSPILAARIETAAGLVARRPGVPVIACGNPREAQVMRDELAQLGVDPDRVVLEPRATTTRRTWRAVRDHLPRPDADVAAVSSRFHLHRVLVEARRQGIRATGVPHRPTGPRRPTARALARRYAREMLATWFYALSGSRT
jgi:uncharacterized SAM-binding protein YcdF (DUF218 family)